MKTQIITKNTAITKRNDKPLIDEINDYMDYIVLEYCDNWEKWNNLDEVSKYIIKESISNAFHFGDPVVEFNSIERVIYTNEKKQVNRVVFKYLVAGVLYEDQWKGVSFDNYTKQKRRAEKLKDLGI